MNKVTDFKTWKHITGQDLEDQINTIIACFDFEKVHKVMKALEWQWYSSQTKDQIPSYGELVLKAQLLIYQAFNDWLKYGWQDDYSTSTGGFHVRLQRVDQDYIVIDLQFVVAEWDNRE